ncbi:uncharacterized protein METZ01_LOCUS311279, partial [marine metagenome]
MRVNGIETSGKLNRRKLITYVS